MRGLKFEALRRYSVGIICANSSHFADLAAIRPALVPSNKLVGYRAKDYPEYHQLFRRSENAENVRKLIAASLDFRKGKTPNDGPEALQDLQDYLCKKMIGGTIRPGACPSLNSRPPMIGITRETP
jgi:hypothetical protein